MDFQVGEKVIYPNHGIGVVESIQTRATPTGKISLYQLRILANDSRVWIPQQNAGGVGLRHVISQGDGFENGDVPQSMILEQMRVLSDSNQSRAACC